MASDVVLVRLRDVRPDWPVGCGVPVPGLAGGTRSSAACRSTADGR